MSKQKTTKVQTTHVVKGKKVKVDREFLQAHIDGGYHLVDFGPHSTPDHGLHGTYESRSETMPDGSPLTVTVSHLNVGVTGGPEFEAKFSDGMVVTSIDEESCLHSIAQRGFGELVPDE